jgi:hypothetical protein
MIYFYHYLLELPILRKWDTGIHLDCFNSLLKSFWMVQTVGEGCIRHFAFATDHVDKIVERVRNAGYMKTNPVSPIRVAFVERPLHESIELFCEKA